MIKPLNNYVLLKKEKQLVKEEKIGSIYVPNKEKDEKNTAIIEAIGNKVENNLFKVGNKVIYKEYSSTSYKENDEEYLLVKEEDILAVIE